MTIICCNLQPVKGENNLTKSVFGEESSLALAPRDTPPNLTAVGAVLLINNWAHTDDTDNGGGDDDVDDVDDDNDDGDDDDENDRW